MDSAPYPIAERRGISINQESNHSGSGWGDAQSSMSDNLDETLDLLAAEINDRTFPTATAAIMEDPPDQTRNARALPTDDAISMGDSTDQSLPISDTMPELHSTPTSCRKATDKVLTDRANQIQSKVDDQFGQIAKQLQGGQIRQNHIVTSADTLVASLQTALTALNLSQRKHEVAIQKNEHQMHAHLKNNQEMMARNSDLEQLSRGQLKYIAIQEERQRTLSDQTATIQQHQRGQQQQLGVRGRATLQMLQDLAKIRARNRNRPGNSEPSSTFPTPVIHEQKGRTGHMANRPERFDEPMMGPGEPALGAIPNVTRAPTRNPTELSPFQVPTNPEHGFTPMPCVGFPNMVVGACPASAPNTFQNWKREIDLRIAGQTGASITQLLAKLIHSLPLSVKTEEPIYMEQAERIPTDRSTDPFMDMLGARFGGPDSERSRAWMSAFADFKREVQGGLHRLLVPDSQDARKS